VPLLVAEVLSPSTRAQGRGIKMQRYGALGIPHSWIVDPDAETIKCWRLEDGAYGLVTRLAAPDLLRHPDWPDFSVDLAALWR
jgi:Uma2 family endonuclease